MNEITPVRIIIGAVVLIVFCLAWISIWRRSRARDRQLKERQAELAAERWEYLHKTRVCPNCYGRGRVPAPGHYFTEDPLRAEYQRDLDDKLEARGIPRVFTDAFHKKE